MRPNTTGLLGFGTRVREVVPDVVTLPQYFKQHGYHSRGFGKIFHIYDESMLGDENDPPSWSERLWLPNVPVWGPEQNRLRNRLIAEARAAGKEFNHPHDWPRAETWDDSDVPDDQMQDGETAAAAAEFLRSRQGNEEPFFLAVGFLRPHLPFNAPKRYWELYDPDKLPTAEFRQIPEGSPAWTVNQGFVKNYHNMPSPEEIDDAFRRRYLQAYLACISYVDACVGNVLQALEQSGKADNTIVVFLGDHGYQMGEYDSWGHKHSNFEISTRAPLLIHVPRMKTQGEATARPVEFLDLYPTLCQLAGLPMPSGVEGENVAVLLDDPSAKVRGYACSEMRRRGRLGHSVRTEDFRLTRWMRNGKTVELELFDHRGEDLTALSSPGLLETRNLAGDPKYQSTVQALGQILDKVFR